MEGNRFFVLTAAVVVFLSGFFPAEVMVSGGDNGRLGDDSWIAFDEPGPSTVYTGPDGATQVCHAYIGPVMTDSLGAARRPVVMVIEYLYGREKIGSSVTLATPGAVGSEPIVSGSGPFATASWEGRLKYFQSLGPASGKTWGSIASEGDVKLTLTSQDVPRSQRPVPLEKA